MACDEKTFPNVDETTFKGIRGELAKIDLELPETHEGTITSAAYGVTAAYRLDETTKVLRVQVTKKPFFVPCNYIYGKLQEAFDRVKNGN